MTSRFGARMRQHRESQNLCLATIADRTKIKVSLLEAIERDDTSHLPPGLYRRAYVRAYADAIGLDADVVVREFLEAYPEPVEPIEPPASPTGFRGLVGSASGSISRARRMPGPQPGAQIRPTAARPEPTTDERVDPGLETVPTMGRVGPVANTAPQVVQPVDLLAAARLCTELGRVETVAQVQTLLAEAAAILDATGLIVWVWDALSDRLRPVLVHGYPEPVIAQLPCVGRDDDNLTADAFRSAQILEVRGTAHVSGALALPLLTANSCAGVLALELPCGSGDTGSMRAVATFIAAMLAQLVGGLSPAASEATVALPRALP